jgi:hypothetical protein
MGSRIVIVAYKPKPGMESELKALTLDHYPKLKEQDLVTDRIPVIMQSQDGTIIEVFEWKSSEAIQQAHTNKAVGQMWVEFSKVCDYIPIGQVSESANLFADYSPIR